MADPDELAERIARKAADALDPLRLEMAIKKWPAEFRVIMWEAVASVAMQQAAESKQEK
jgi:hypothetical protein